MEYVEVNQSTYGLVRDFKHNRQIRTSFNKLTQSIYGFSLENWYQDGYWGDHYIPYSLLHDNEVVSNVSISKLEYDIENERKIGVQIGTVMTAEEYRHQGLNKFILEQVIKGWKDQADFIYLFANDTVLDFYPKFNFEKVAEYQCSRQLDYSETQPSLRKLNVNDKSDLSLLIEAIKISVPLSKVALKNNLSLTMFYCLSIKKNDIYYIENLKTIVISEFKGDTVFLEDVFSKEALELEDIIQAISGTLTKNVVLGFTPLKDWNYSKTLIERGDTLFMLKGQEAHFKDNHWMFPVLSHA